MVKKSKERLQDAESSVAGSSKELVNVDTPVASADSPPQDPISGRAVFAVSRVDVGVAVHTAFLVEDGRLLQMPAVFPNLEYGLQQVDEMRQMLINQFSMSDENPEN